MSDCSSQCSDSSYLSDLDDQCKSHNYDISNGSPIDPANFNVVHYNINSILANDRIEQLTDICTTLRIDVLILSESKLDQTIPNNLITIPGYHEPLRHDRNRHGGGVPMYIAENLVYQHRSELQSNNYEHLWADARINDKVFAINGLYRPPNEDAENHKLFLETAEIILTQLYNYDKAEYKILSGDLNLGNIYCKVPIVNPKPLDNTAPALFFGFGFQHKPARRSHIVVY